ncbi:MAG: N-acetyltransferase [Azospirillaceae bacterium]
MSIRDEAPADRAVIRQIIEAAFAGTPHGSGTEGAIVDALRETGTLTVSLVAEADGQIVGHVALSPVTVAGEDVGWFGLGPVSVRPERQGQGIGGALVRAGLTRLRAQGARGCVVLGDPGYYRRFGFTHDPALRFAGAPPEYFLRLSFSGTPPAGEVIYQPAFHDA